MIGYIYLYEIMENMKASDIMKSGKNERYFRKYTSKRNGTNLQKLCNKLTKNTVALRGWMRFGSRRKR
jgi:hypothetical protein